MGGQADERHGHHPQRRLVVLPDDEQVAAALTAEVRRRGIGNRNRFAQPGDDAASGPHPQPLARQAGEGSCEQVVQEAILFHLRRRVAFKDDLWLRRAVFPLSGQRSDLLQVLFPLLIG
ncbi:MAG: hypothetical protein ACK4WK_08010, partial [Anaerolineae bacterium]